MNVLVTGGAGYIGSHALRALRAAGHIPIVLDTLENGYRQAVGQEELICADVADSEVVSRALREFAIEIVMHFAAYIEVGESMRTPMKYYRNNLLGTTALLAAMAEAGVRRFIFSSTAAVYGEPEEIPIPETAPCRPVNVYGHAKAQVEEICAWLSRQTDFRYVALRYFNAAGAHPSAEIGEAHKPESHLIPLVLQVALGQRPAVQIFGADYPTPDGTCIRDYIHVCDLVEAHVRAIDYLDSGGPSVAINLGTGQGYSVRHIIEMAREVTGHPIPAEMAPRRPGDPPQLVARVEKASQLLGWQPRQSDLRTIVASAWQWHSRHPQGYSA